MGTLIFAALLALGTASAWAQSTFIEGYECGFVFKSGRYRFSEAGTVSVRFPSLNPAVKVSSSFSGESSASALLGSPPVQNFKVRAVRKDANEEEYLYFYLTAQELKEADQNAPCNVIDGFGQCLERWWNPSAPLAYCDPHGELRPPCRISSGSILDSRLSDWVLKVNTANPQDAWLLRSKGDFRLAAQAACYPILQGELAND